MSEMLPPTVQFAAGRLQDQLRIWRARPPGIHHQRYRDTNVKAVELCGDVIAAFQRFREELTAELGAYDDERRAKAAGLDALTDHDEYIAAAEAEERHVDTVDPRTLHELDDAIVHVDGARAALRDVRARLTAV